MLGRLCLAGGRVPNAVFEGTALMVCFAATACSGSESTTSQETTVSQATSGKATTAGGTNLPAYANTPQPQIEEQMTNLRIPGALVYVDIPGEDLGAKPSAHGTSRDNTPITPNDQFRIASNTRTFTGTLVLQLVNEGQLGLDDPVSTYQPEEWPGSGTRVRPPDTR